MKHIITAFALIALLNAPASAADIDGYANTPINLDNIGRSYMGRDIAAVMGHEGASWLDRPEREQEEAASKVVPLLGLKPTDAVADIGAGTGYFTFRLAAAVPQGKVFAQDIEEKMLDIIKARATSGRRTNVVTVLGGVKDPRIPKESVDLILLVDSYHEFSYPREMGIAMVYALKPGGRIALVEYRGEDDSVPSQDSHRMTVAQATKEMSVLGLKLVSANSKTLPWQHVMIFQKSGTP